MSFLTVTKVPRKSTWFQIHSKIPELNLRGKFFMEFEIEDYNNRIINVAVCSYMKADYSSAYRLLSLEGLDCNDEGIINVQRAYQDEFFKIVDKFNELMEGK